jgi:hypothetical protein
MRRRRTAIERADSGKRIGIGVVFTTTQLGPYISFVSIICQAWRLAARAYKHTSLDCIIIFHRPETRFVPVSKLRWYTLLFRYKLAIYYRGCVKKALPSPHACNIYA